MSEYIKREAAINAVFEAFADGRSAYYALENIPAADVRPVRRGKWIKGKSWSVGCGMGEDYGFYYDCSVCGDTVQGDYSDCGMNFCPNCGADMREGS